MKADIDGNLADHDQKDWECQSISPGRDKADQQKEGCKPVDWLKRVQRLDGHHGRAELAETGIARHVPVPALGLQEARKPAPPLPKERHECFGRVGPCAGSAYDPDSPVHAMFR